MSSKLAAPPITAQTAMTRMSISLCSTFQSQRGSSIGANSLISASSMAVPSVDLSLQIADIDPPDLMRRPCLLTDAQRANLLALPTGKRPETKLGLALQLCA